MKKAVAHLIPFMEEEREAQFKLSGEQVQESVRNFVVFFLNRTFVWSGFLSYHTAQNVRYI